MCSLGETGVVLSSNASAVFGLSSSQGIICEALIPARPAVQTLATFVGGFLAGRPAVTRVPPSAGAGSVVYAGFASDDASFYEWIVGVLVVDAGLPPLDPALRLPYGVEVSVRDVNATAAAVFVLNWGGANVTARVPDAAGGTDLIGGGRIGPEGDVLLEPYGLAVITVST